MKTLVIVAHPEFSNSSTQHFLKEAVDPYDDVTFHVLKPPLNVAHEKELVQSHDRLIFQFPFYWYSAPAILKAWIDDVLTDQSPNKELGLVVTIAVREAAYQAGGEIGFTVSELLRPYEALAKAKKWHFLPSLPIFKFAYMSDNEQLRLAIRYQRYCLQSADRRLLDRENWAIQELGRLVTETTDNHNRRRKALLESLLLELEDKRDERLELEALLQPFREEDLYGG